jgi:hypothetical protein
MSTIVPFSKHEVGLHRLVALDPGDWRVGIPIAGLLDWPKRQSSRLVDSEIAQSAPPANSLWRLTWESACDSGIIPALIPGNVHTHGILIAQVGIRAGLLDRLGRQTVAAA